MKLLLKQKLFSWFDSYNVYDEYGETVFKVKGQLSFGHRLVVYDANGREIGMLKEKVFAFLPRFYMYVNGVEIGWIKKKFTFFKPQFELNCNGWLVDGNFFEWDYSVYENNNEIITLSKEIFNFTDTYVIDVKRPEDGLLGLLIVLAIDAEKCSRN
ncbi:MAG: hypothetical protein GX896_04365 [Clostridiales bacterium]|nr:hypothetical protein [Clostridiales bacterium]